MGWCLTLFAVRGKTPEAVRADLGLLSTGESINHPGARILGTQLPGGWYLIRRHRYECRDDTVFAKLSAGCQVVSLFVEEHVMVSRASEWKDGRQVWSVTYNSEKGDKYLETEGAVPPDFVSIRNDVGDGADAGIGDYFGIPCRLATVLTGYSYYAPTGGKNGTVYEVLARPSLWTKLFGW